MTRDPRCPACGTFKPMAYCWACGDRRDTVRDAELNAILNDRKASTWEFIQRAWQHGFETGKQEQGCRDAAAYSVATRRTG